MLTLATNPNPRDETLALTRVRFRAADAEGKQRLELLTYQRECAQS